MKRLTVLIVFFSVWGALFAPWVSLAEAAAPADEGIADTLLPATVAFVLEERQVVILDEPQTIQVLELAISSGPRRGEIVTVEYGAAPDVQASRFRVGNRVFLRQSQQPDGSFAFEIAARDRSFPLMWLFLGFVGLVVLAGGQRGARSLAGMALSFGVLFWFVLPRVGAGLAPVETALLGCGLVMPFSYYLSHGLNRKTTIALIGSLFGLGLTALVALGVVSLTGLTGLSGDEAAFVQSLYGGAIDLRGLLLAGMIIGVLGVLDDITVAQSAIVEQLREANRGLDTWQLYRRAMHVGQDHIASMVNTLVLVYAGAALPLLLLLTDQALPIGYLLSQELISEEVVRMLVTSTGLVLAVPLTTLLAARWVGTRRSPEPALASDALAVDANQPSEA